MAGGCRSGQNERVAGEVGKLVEAVAAWTAVSVLLAALFYWLRPKIPTRRMVVVVRAGDRRRIVAVSGRRRAFGSPDRVVAEIDPQSRLITLPQRRVPTADTGAPIIFSGRLRYEIADSDKAAGAAEPIAVALGDGIVAAVDEKLRDLPVGQAVRLREETARRLTEALTTVRVYGLSVTEIELTTFMAAAIAG
jgi:hypothetical protein